MQTKAQSIYPAKRCFDILVSSIGLLLFSPVIVLFLIAIAAEHCIRLRPLDPLFYTETRYSQGRPFTLIKFNIFLHEIVLGMRARGEFIHTKKLERAGELLLVGKLLKQIYLDELPQLFNVLRGDMSIVGPRPLNIDSHKYFLNKGSGMRDRVRGGLTGLYQATHKDSHSSGSSEELDGIYVTYYFSNPWYRVLLFDMKIILRTIKVLLKARGI